VKDGGSIPPGVFYNLGVAGCIRKFSIWANDIALPSARTQEAPGGFYSLHQGENIEISGEEVRVEDGFIEWVGRVNFDRATCVNE